MKIFPYDPPKFSLELLERMRKHPNIEQMPSPRQVLTIPQLILARYIRKGQKLSAEDYIDIGMATSFPNNQELAKEVAFQILFPNHTIQDLQSFLEGKSIEEIKGKSDKKVLLSEEDHERQLIQQLSDEIECGKHVDPENIRQIERFFNNVFDNKDLEPFKSGLAFIYESRDFFENKIKSIDVFLNLIKKRIVEKINILKPLELVAINNLGLSHLVIEHSRRPWELFTIKIFGKNNKTIDSILSEIRERKFRFSDLVKVVEYIRDVNILNVEQNNQLNKILSMNIQTIQDLHAACFKLGEIPSFDLDNILVNSFYMIPLDQILELSRDLEHTFGLNLRAPFFDLLHEEFKRSNPVAMDNVEYGLLELISQYGIASNSWYQLFQKTMVLKQQKAMNAFRAYIEFKNLTYLALSLSNSNENVYCAHLISQFLPQLVKATFHSCIVPTELKNVLEFFKKLGLDYDKNDIKAIGLKVGMSEDKILELIEKDYEILKLLMSKPQNDLKKIQDLTKKIKQQLDDEKILELMKLALGSHNIAGLAALASLNLEKSLEAAKQIQGRAGMEKVISSLTATDGESLIKQWFLHRDKIPNIFKQKIKNIAKKVLIELGINYSKTYIGSLSSGLIQSNLIRPYEMGDDVDDVDLEESMLNLLENGKTIKHLSYDDLYVFITSSGIRSICIELDISESMTGEKIAYMAICVTMLVYGLRKEELGIVLFEKDVHVLKELHQKIEMETLADELLEISSRGTTFVSKPLHWAREQFKRAYRSSRKINILLTDAEIYDIPNASETLRAFKSLGTEFILVCPEKEYNKKQSEKMIKLAGGQIITVDSWESFPEKFVSIINSRF